MLLAIHAEQRCCVLGVDTFGFGQTFQVRHVAFACIAAHDRLHGGVGFKVVESTPIVLPLIRQVCASRSNTKLKIRWWVSASIRRRVREMVT